MVKYYGRAKQRTGSVNRNQPGLKRQGVMGSGGKPRFLTRHINNRVNANAKTGCVENGKLTGKLLIFSNGEQICADNEGYQLIPKAPRSRACAGGVGQIQHTRCNYTGNNSSSGGSGPTPPPPVACKPIPNELFHQLIKDYYLGSEEIKQAIIDEYCVIEEWDVSQVTKMPDAFTLQIRQEIFPECNSTRIYRIGM